MKPMKPKPSARLTLAIKLNRAFRALAIARLNALLESNRTKIELSKSPPQ